MRVRVEGALSEFHTGDVQYHVNCMASFVSPKSISAVKHHFLDDIAVLSSPGLSSLVVFRQNALTILHLTGDTDNDTQDLFISKACQNHL